MSLINSIKYKLGQQYYRLGFLQFDELTLSTNERFKKIKWLDTGSYSEGWFADPFLLSCDDDKVEVLAEEWVYSQHKGRLVYLLIDRSCFKLKEKKVILELDTHLSFPNIIKQKDKTYVYPENYQSGGVYIYEYDKLNKMLRNPKLIIDQPLVDVQIVEIEHKFYAFGVLRKNGSMDETKQVQIYVSDTLFGTYKYHQTISNEHNQERGAGKIFEYKGEFYRPVQDCDKGYGTSTIIYKLSQNDNLFQEKEAFRLDTNHSKKLGLALHTFNFLNDICVIDGQDYHHFYLAKFLRRR